MNLDVVEHVVANQRVGIEDLEALNEHQEWQQHRQRRHEAWCAELACNVDLLGLAGRDAQIQPTELITMHQQLYDALLQRQQQPESSTIRIDTANDTTQRHRPNEPDSKHIWRAAR